MKISPRLTFAFQNFNFFYSKKIKSLSILFLITLLVNGVFAQVTLTSRASGVNWNSVNTWLSGNLTGTISNTNGSTTINGTGTSFTTELSVGAVLYRTDGTTAIGTIQTIDNNTKITLTGGAANGNTNISFRTRKIPTSTDIVIISTDDAITIPTATAANCASLQIGVTATSSSETLTFTASTSTLTCGGDVDIFGNRGNDTRTIAVGAGFMSVGGNLTIGTDGQGSTNTNRESFLTISTGTVSVTGNVTLNCQAAAQSRITFSGAGILNVGGAFTLTNAFGTLTPSTGTVNFNSSTVAQTIPIGVSSVTYNNVQINNTFTSGAIISAAITATNVTGNLSVQSGTFDNGGFTIALANNKSFSVATASTFILSGTSSAMPTVSGTGTRTVSNTSTVKYNGTGNQTVPVLTYGDLELNGGGVKTFSGATTIAGDLSINGTRATFATGTNSTANSLTLTGYAQLTGTWGGLTSGATNINPTYFNTSTGKITIATTAPCGTIGLWIGATNTDWNTGTNWCGGNVPTASTDVIIQAGPVNQPNIAAATTAVSNSITINSGATLTLTNSATSLLNISGNLTNNGTLTQGAASTIAFNASSGTQTVNSLSSFTNILHNNAGTLQLLTNSLTATGTFTNSAGTFDANGVAATITGLTTVSGGTYIASTATQTFNGDLIVSGGIFSGSTGIVTSTNVTLSSGTLTAPSGTFNITGDWSNNGGTFNDNGGTLIFTGTTQAIGGTTNTTFGILRIDAGSVTTMNNSNTCSSLTFIASGTASSLTQASGTVFTINGVVTINQPTAAVTTAWNINSGTATVSGLITFAGASATANRINKIVTTTGTLNANGGITFITAASANHVIDMSGGAGTLNLKGALTIPATSATLTAGTAGSTFNYADANAQTINYFTGGAYYNLTTNNATGATLSAAIIATNMKGDLNIQSGIFNNGGLAMTLASAKSLTVSANTIFNLTGTSTNVAVSGGGTRTYDPTSTTNYAGAAQTVTADTYGNLYLSGSGTKTFSGLTTIAGELNIISTAKPTFTNNTVSTANTLTLGGLGQNLGTWGGTGSGATNISTTFFNATTNGRVLVSNNSCATAGTWLGAISTDWNTAGNWCGGVPTASTNVVISTGTANQPTIGASAVCNDITINSGATLTISSTNTLTVSGNWANTGTFTAGTSTVIFNGASSQQMNDTSTTTFYNLTINKPTSSATITSGNPGHAFIVNGALTVTQGNLILQAIDAGYTITGDLTVSTNGTLTHSVNWDVAGKQITLSGSLIIDGQWVYTVRSHLQMNGVNKTIKTGPYPSALSILTLANTSGTISANDSVTIMDNFWAAFNVAGGTFATNGNTVIAKSVLLNSGGTVNVNGGNLNVTGGLLMGSSNVATLGGTVNVTSGGTLTTDLIKLGDRIGTVASTLTQNGGTVQVNGPVTIKQPVASVINTWNIGADIATVNGLITFDTTLPSAATRVGKIIITSGTLNANGGMAFLPAFAASHIIDMSGGAGILNLKGALTVPATSSTLTAGASSIFNYADANAQTINYFNAGAYNNLYINNTNASGATLSGAITTGNVTGNIVVGSTTPGSLFSNGNLAIGFNNSKSLTIAAGSAMNAGTGVTSFTNTLANPAVIINGTFKTGMTSTGFSGATGSSINSTNNPVISLGTNSTIEYNASGVQAVTARVYNNLALSGTSNKTFAGTTTVNSNLSISGTAVALLNNGTTSSTLSLTLGGINRITGSWGGTTSAATNKNSQYFGTTTTGILNDNVGCTAGTWLGAFSTDWNEIANWCGGIPTSTTDVTIPTTTNQPIIGTAGMVCRNLTINSTASLTINGSNSLIVSGNWANNGGTFNQNSSTVTFNGANASIGGTGNTTFNNLTISGTTVTATANMNVAGDLNIITGTFDLSTFTANRTISGGTLTIASGATLKLGGTNTIPSNYATHSINANSTIEYSGTTQSVALLNSSQNYGNITISGSGTKTLNANVGVAGDLTVSAGILDLSTFTADRISSGGTLTLSGGTTLKIGGTNTFPSNYVTHSIDLTSTVEYSGASQSIATTNATPHYGNLSLSGSGAKTLSGNISLAGNWTRFSGPTFNSANNSVTFTTANASTIKAPETTLTRDTTGSFGGETFSYLIINKSAKANTVKLLSNIAITKTMTLTQGTLDLDTSDVVLASNAKTTADLGPVNTTNADISYSSTGRFIPQRYIGNTSYIRTWRFLTAPLQASDTLSISSAWQEGLANPVAANPTTNPWPGYGTHITGARGAFNAANGFDDGGGQASYSIEYYDNTTGATKLSYPASTKSVRLMSQLGWAIFIRGDRGTQVGNVYVNSNNTTLEPKGKINIGNVTSTIVANRTNVVGNPYPCQINMEKVVIGGADSADFKLWDPEAFTNYAKTGKYIFFNWNGTSYDANNGPVTVWLHPGTVESGEAFLTYNNVAGSSIVFHESDKITGASTSNGIQSRPIGNRPMNTPYAKFQADLQYYNAESDNYTNISGANAYFNSIFSPSIVTGEDNVSPVGTNIGELRILKEDQQLSTDREPIISSTDTIFLYLSKANQAAHRLVLSSKYFVPNAQAILVDKYLNDQQTPVAISNTDSTFYDFEITDDVQSNRSDRFMVIFHPITEGPLAVKFSSVKASQQSNGTVAVEWKVENELNTKSYEVERSSDGVHFTKVNTTIATSAGSYNWLDATPNGNNNYYRIRLLDQTGAEVYSQIVLVKTGNAISEINVLPNVIESNMINLQFTNQINGLYKIRLLNVAGQTMDATEIKVNGNSSSESFAVKAILSKGIYQLEIVSPENKKVVKKVFVK